MEIVFLFFVKMNFSILRYQGPNLGEAALLIRNEDIAIMWRRLDYHEVVKLTRSSSLECATTEDEEYWEDRLHVRV